MYFVSISISIAYDSRSALVSSGAEKCSFEKLPGRVWRLPTSIFDAVAHFVCLPPELQHSPNRGPATLASQLSGPFPAPAHCCPVWVCSSTADQGAIKAVSLLQLSPEWLTGQWWHLMTKDQVFQTIVEGFWGFNQLNCLIKSIWVIPLNWMKDGMGNWMNTRPAVLEM